MVMIDSKSLCGLILETFINHLAGIAQLVERNLAKVLEINNPKRIKQRSHQENRGFQANNTLSKTAKILNNSC